MKFRKTEKASTSDVQTHEAALAKLHEAAQAQRLMLNGLQSEIEALCKEQSDIQHARDQRATTLVHLLAKMDELEFAKEQAAAQIRFAGESLQAAGIDTSMLADQAAQAAQDFSKMAALFDDLQQRDKATSATEEARLLAIAQQIGDKEQACHKSRISLQAVENLALATQKMHAQAVVDALLSIQQDLQRRIDAAQDAQDAAQSAMDAFLLQARATQHSNPAIDVASPQIAGLLCSVDDAVTDTLEKAIAFVAALLEHRGDCIPDGRNPASEYAYRHGYLFFHNVYNLMPDVVEGAITNWGNGAQRLQEHQERLATILAIYRQAQAQAPGK